MKKVQKAGPIEPDRGASEWNRLGLERLVFFSDAVFAIAITVLVLDIRLPAGADSASDRRLFDLLVGLWHKYLAYVISFWVIGLYWMSHHRKFLLIRRFDHGLLSINLLLLMVIAFIPFPTAVLSENGNLTATIFYGLVMAMAGLILSLLWWHAARQNKLIAPNLDRRRRRREVVAPLVMAGIFLLSTGVAFLDTGLVRICWFLILPASLFLSLRLGREPG